MNTQDQILFALEELHIPYAHPDCPPDWKDWYHYVLFDPYSGTKILFNMSLSGRQGAGEVVTTLVVIAPDHSPPHNSYGFMDIAEWKTDMVSHAPVHISSSVAEITFDQLKVDIKVSDKNKQLSLCFTGTSIATPILIPEFFPFGNGFVGWGFVPGLIVNGYVTYGDKQLRIDPHWFCYHDHNYGRFNWGAGIGWIWWIASMKSEEGKTMTFVFHRGNIVRIGIPYLFIYENNILQKAFIGDTLQVTIQNDGKPKIPVILPGTLASVFNDKHVNSISSIHILGKDDRDRVRLDMFAEDTIQIILPDYRKKQYSFLSEISGRLSASYSIGGKQTKSRTGNFYAEYVY